ncbi:MAG TPA: amidohydrolase family protein [Vicinamibacterales bacterium]|nr:amidohydrolase family protein [Vicinamibacterales bacterium]
MAPLKGAPYVLLAIAVFVGRSFQGRLDAQRLRATVYEHARLIDGSGGPAMADAAFVVADGHFTQIGRAGSVRAPTGAARVDLSGKTVMPALVDAHVHLGYRKGTTFTADNFTPDVIHEQLRQFGYWGVSAVLSTGTDVGETIFPLRAETNAPAYVGTMIRTAWRGLAPPDAGPFPPMRAAPFGVTSVEAARADVRELAAHHADLVKIWLDDRNGTVPKLSPAIYRAIIDEAHAHGLRVIAHVTTLADVKALLHANIDGFAHMFRDRDADAELLGLLKARPKVFFMLTLWAPRLAAMTEAPAWLDDPRLLQTATAAQIAQFRAPFANRTAQSVAAARAEWIHLQHNVAALGSAGVTLVLGTDVGGNTGGPLFGWTEHMELENMVAAGMTPVAAIAAATRGSADALRLRDLGTIAAGKRADFLVLDANPLDDITHSRRIAAVYQRGVEIRSK